LRLTLVPFRRRLDQAKATSSGRSATGSKGTRLAPLGNQLKSHLMWKNTTLLQRLTPSAKQDFDNAVQTNLANQAQVKGGHAAIRAAKAQIQAYQAAVEAATINLNFTRIVHRSTDRRYCQAQVGDLVSNFERSSHDCFDPQPHPRLSQYEQEYLALRKQFLGSVRNNGNCSSFWPTDAYPHQGEFFFADRQVNQNYGDDSARGPVCESGKGARPGQYGKVRAMMRGSVLLVSSCRQ